MDNILEYGITVNFFKSTDTYVGLNFYSELDKMGIVQSVKKYGITVRATSIENKLRKNKKKTCTKIYVCTYV